MHGVWTISTHDATGAVVHVRETTRLLHLRLRSLHLHALLQKLKCALVLDKEAGACILLLVRQLNACHAGLHRLIQHLIGLATRVCEHVSKSLA